MTKIDKTVIKETVYVSAWILILSAVMESVFLIIGKWTLPVLYGNLLSAAVSAANFLIMGITIQKAVGRDENKAALMMKISQTLRYLMIFAVAATGVLLDCFNTVAVLLPLFFPRIGIAFRPLFSKKENK